jgi:solute carrier family 50 protein (sugar transporter)
MNATTFTISYDYALRVAGPIFFLGLQFSTAQTALKLHKDKSVGQLSPLQFISLFTNCFIWSLYGFLKPDYTVLYPNLIGVIVGLSSIFIYQLYSTKSILYYNCVSGAIVLYSLFLASENNFQMLGSIGCFLAVIMVGSPLSSLSTVIKDKSTASLPFTVCLMGWLNSLSWMTYGVILANDPLVSLIVFISFYCLFIILYCYKQKIYLPNGLGFFLGTVQLMLFAIYGFDKTKVESPKDIV